jgi:septum formation inhibitor MinC
MDDTMKRTADGSWVSKTPADYARERREAEAKQQTPQQRQEPDAWTTIVNKLLRSGTHSRRHRSKFTIRVLPQESQCGRLPLS